jgi:hypothetical protein
MTGSKLSSSKLSKSLAGITREMSRLNAPLVLQLKLTLTRDRYHDRRIMIAREVFGLAFLGRDVLLRWRFIEIDLHPRMSLSHCRHASSKFKHFLWKGFVLCLCGEAIVRFLLKELELRNSHPRLGDSSG